MRREGAGPDIDAHIGPVQSSEGRLDDIGGYGRTERTRAERVVKSSFFMRGPSANLMNTPKGISEEPLKARMAGHYSPGFSAPDGSCDGDWQSSGLLSSWHSRDLPAFAWPRTPRQLRISPTSPKGRKREISAP